MDQEGIGPLHSACMADDYLMLEMLLKRGEHDIEARTRTCKAVLARFIGVSAAS
ncbi:unnamed protein product [Ectocarpus sp. 6 AP-2014]